MFTGKKGQVTRRRARPIFTRTERQAFTRGLATARRGISTGVLAAERGILSAVEKRRVRLRMIREIQNTRLITRRGARKIVVAREKKARQERLLRKTGLTQPEARRLRTIFVTVRPRRRRR